MKILIVCDQLDNWSAHNRAKAIQKFLPEFSIEIRGGVYEPGIVSDHDKFDLVHFNFSYRLTDFYDFIMANQRKVIITNINERSLLANHGVDPVKFKELLTGCPWVTSVSKKVADLVGCRYIPNGIDEDKFHVHKLPVVGYSGTDKENKNVQMVREACLRLGLPFQSKLYNYGQLDLPHERMQEFYNSIDVFVHASLTEGFNNTIIEALSCNVPVLMTRQGCWEEFVGWVEFIEPTAESIVEALKKYAGRRLIDARFLWRNIIPLYKQIYEEAYACAKISLTK